jgi:hypothetical protein
MNSAVLRHLVTSLCFIARLPARSRELEAAERPRSQVGDTGDALGCVLQIGGGADLTRAIRAYRALPPCAARGDIPPTQRTNVRFSPRKRTLPGSTRTSALGHKQTYAVQTAMSALPPKATTKANSRKSHVCFTPESGHVRCN